jgi:hypothetical protein
LGDVVGATSRAARAAGKLQSAGTNVITCRTGVPDNTTVRDCPSSLTIVYTSKSRPMVTAYVEASACVRDRHHPSKPATNSQLLLL